MNPSSTYRLEFDPRAWREIMALPEAVQNQIFEAAEKLEKAPRPSGCKKLKRPGDFYRIRTVNYRIIYEVRDQALVVTVVRAGDRKDIYD
ncbi:MAG TPA: type II toxin-antitoxin system RelE/ParE family toxin [Abditibacterium sp.]|jgi:mRNA interferase RelE/StbE